MMWWREWIMMVMKGVNGYGNMDIELLIRCCRIGGKVDKSFYW